MYLYLSICLVLFLGIAREHIKKVGREEKNSIDDLQPPSLVEKGGKTS